MLGEQEEAEGVVLPSYKSSWLFSSLATRRSPCLRRGAVLHPAVLRVGRGLGVGTKLPSTVRLEVKLLRCLPVPGEENPTPAAWSAPRLHLHCSLLLVSVQSNFLSFLGNAFLGTTALKMLRACYRQFRTGSPCRIILFAFFQALVKLFGKAQESFQERRGLQLLMLLVWPSCPSSSH